MKTARILLLALLPLLATGAWAQTSLSATLEGGTGLDPDGSGYAIVTINGTQVSYTILVNGIAAPNGAGVRRASDNTVVVNLNPTFVGGLATGTVTASQANADAITGNPTGYYVNVQNTEFPDGALRGTLAYAGTGSSEPTVLYLPVAAKNTGLVGTDFKTDVQIANPGPASVSVTMDYFIKEPAGLTAPTATQTRTIGAGQQLAVEDVLGSVFSRGNERGALRLSASAGFQAQARTYNDQRGTSFALPGTFSFYTRALTMSEIATSGQLLGLSQTPSDQAVDYRTNIVYYNPNSTPVTVTMAAKKDDGTVLGTKVVTLQGNASDIVAVFDLIDTVPADQRTQKSFFITFSSTGAAIIGATVTDNITGDSLYVSALPLS